MCAFWGCSEGDPFSRYLLQQRLPFSLSAYGPTVLHEVFLYNIRIPPEHWGAQAWRGATGGPDPNSVLTSVSATSWGLLRGRAGSEYESGEWRPRPQRCGPEPDARPLISEASRGASIHRPPLLWYR
jgi:hypothetical protein